MTKTPALELKGIRKHYGKTAAVDGIDFTAAAGTVFSLLGPNGAGKSTTISMIAGLVKPDTGTIRVFGRFVSGKSAEVKKILGVVPQDIALYQDLSAEENLSFWGKMYGLRGKELAARIDEVLALMGLEDRRRDKIETYSGGMKRRVNIAAALLHRPELLIMDEPTVGIDPQSRRHILDNVKALRDSGTSILYTTHYMEEAAELSDFIAVMDKGLIIAEGTHADLVEIIGGLDKVSLQVRDEKEPVLSAWGNVPEIEMINFTEQMVTFFTKDADNILPQLFRIAHDKNIHIISMEVEEPNLESVFLHLTGRELRD